MLKRIKNLLTLIKSPLKLIQNLFKPIKIC